MLYKMHFYTKTVVALSELMARLFILHSPHTVRTTPSSRVCVNQSRMPSYQKFNK